MTFGLRPYAASILERYIKRTPSTNKISQQRHALAERILAKI